MNTNAKPIWREKQMIVRGDCQYEFPNFYPNVFLTTYSMKASSYKL